MMEIDDSIKITSQSIQKAGTSAEFPNIQITQQSKMVNNQQINRTRNNFSETMKDIINKKYNSLYYINTDTNINTRIQMADIWENERPQNKDTILKTKKGFLLKTDTPKAIIEETLKKMKNSKKINEYSTATPYIQRNKERSLPLPNYSCVIARVEKEINDEELNNHLKKANYEFRYCKRIISKQTNTPTSLIRIITGNINTYEKILSEGVFYKSRHYPAYPSNAPDPAPLPCSKCLQYTHCTKDCTEPTKCLKCNEEHSTNKCKSNLPPKCNGCGSTDHQAWSFKCPKRPTQPIEGIPNLPVKTLNKRSNQIDPKICKNSRIHAPVTIHDTIVNTYISKLNNPKNSNRENLIEKLKKKFISEYNIDTALTFVGNNWVYILMFDLDLDEPNSPTETVHQNMSRNVRL